MSSRRDIDVVLKTLERYEKATLAKINYDKFSGLRLGAWKGVNLPGLFVWTDGSIRILRV